MVEPSPDASGEQLMIEADGLSKYYGAFAAIDEVRFSVPLKQVCALLGPNGLASRPR